MRQLHVICSHLVCLALHFRKVTLDHCEKWIGILEMELMQLGVGCYYKERDDIDLN